MALTVGELKEMLEQYSDDTPVHISYNYGDHWHTHVAPKADMVEEVGIVYSEYHNMDKLADDDDYDGEEGTVKHVVVIS
jgi:hypothetical protein